MEPRYEPRQSASETLLLTTVLPLGEVTGLYGGVSSLADGSQLLALIFASKHNLGRTLVVDWAGSLVTLESSQAYFNSGLCFVGSADRHTRFISDFDPDLNSN